ncbi:MAG: hypothetical protein RIB60_11645 [Phycisphaerales bacterium]
MTIVVATRALGGRRPLLDDFSVDPPAGVGGDEDLTLRQLIIAVVQEQVRLFNKRRLSRRFDRVLTDQQIDSGARKGKIDAAGREQGDDAEPEQAVAAALLGFEDGLYIVIIDAVERRDLDEVIRLLPDSRMTFIRLAFLAGA